MAVAERELTVYTKPESPITFGPELDSVPPFRECKQILGEFRVYVGTHESQHALVGKDKGLVVKEISTIPDGKIKGYTKFAPTSNIKSLQISSAASMVPGPHGDPMGFGHDAQQIHYMSMFEGSTSFDSALSSASSSLSIYPMKVRERIGEIVAYLGKVDGTKLDKIIKKAEHDVKEYRSIPDYGMKVDKEDKKSDIKSEFTIVMKRLKNGQIVERVVEVTVCEQCGGRGEHMSYCDVAEREENIIEFPEELELAA
jgi:hypothetical protein